MGGRLDSGGGGDVWLDKVPLKISYHELFRICGDPQALVADVVIEGMLDVNFRRGLDEGLMEQWRELEGKLMAVTILYEEDMVVWALEKHGCIQCNLCIGT
jgi:hypothetical protein